MRILGISAFYHDSAAALVDDSGIVAAAREERYIKEGKNAIDWTRLSCHGFRNNEVRLQLHALAYNLGNFPRALALPEAAAHWSLTTLRA